MSKNQKFNDYGQQFKIEIEHALQSGDFSGLNQLVNDTVTSAVNGVADQMAGKTQRTSYYKGDAADSDKYYDAAPGSYKETTMYRSDGKSGSYAGGEAKGSARTQDPLSGHTKNQNAQSSSSRGYERATTNFDSYAHNYDRRTPNYDRRDPGRPRPDRTGEFQRSKYDFRTPQTAAGSKKNTPVKNEVALMKNNGKISGTLMQIFGGIGIGTFGVTSLVFSLLCLILGQNSFLVLAVLFFVLSGVSLGILGNGNRRKKRLQVAQRYFEMAKEKGYINISKIAEYTGEKEKKIVKELQKLIAAGIFPQGHLDQEEKCFMLTDDTYKQYQRVKQQRSQLEDDELRKQQEEQQKAREKEKAQAGLTEQQKELYRMVEEGQNYIRQIRERNDAIPGEVISQKLYRMEELLKEIFTNLEKMPEQMPKMQKLMHYYLPTTLKLVTAYEQFDQVSVPGEDIISAKKEIENTIDTINAAYGELLNKLFADSAMDVTTDAQVLKTMLAKEGLVDDNPMEKQP